MQQTSWPKKTTISTYTIFGIALIIFIRTENQSKQKFYNFLDGLTKSEFLKNSQVQKICLVSPEIFKQTSKVIKKVPPKMTTPNDQSDKIALPKTCTSLLTLGSWKNFKIIKHTQLLSEAEFNESSTLFHHNSKYYKMTNLYKPNETYDFTYSGGV